MLRFKSIMLLSALFATSFGYSQFTDVINSNRPGESMGAFSVGKTVLQVELGGYLVQEDHEYLNYDSAGVGSDLSIRYGAFFEQLEFIADLQYQNDVLKTENTSFRRSGLKQTTFGAKYLVFDPNKNYDPKPDLKSWKNNHKFSYHNFIPAVGVYAGLNVRFGNEFGLPFENKLSPKFMLLTQNQFGKYVLVTNVISDNVTTSFPTLAYVVTITRGFNDRLSAFVENQGIQSDYYADSIVRVGAAWLVAEHIQIDASIGTSLKTTPSMLMGGIGVSWRFDELYEEVMLRSPTEALDKDKGKSKKEKKGKKRKDAVETEQTDLP